MNHKISSHPVPVLSEFPPFDLPRELLLNIVKKLCYNPSSFEQNICTIALISKEMSKVADILLRDKICELNRAIDLTQKKIKSLTSKVDQIACFFRDRLKQVEIIPTLEDQRILYESYQFETHLETFSKLQLEVSRKADFTKLISESSKAKLFLPNYKICQTTHHHLISLEKTLRKLEILFEEKFINKANELKLA